MFKLTKNYIYNSIDRKTQYAGASISLYIWKLEIIFFLPVQLLCNHRTQVYRELKICVVVNEY